MANFDHRSVVSADKKTYKAPVNRGDSIAKIAKANGTTTEILRQLNPRAAILQPGQVLIYQKGSVQRVIIGWKTITVQEVAKLYNGGGDPKYAQKLAFALNLLKRGVEARCD